MHSSLVARVALWLAKQLKKKNVSVNIDEKLLRAAALLHDIDKNVSKLPGEQHPDAGVRILEEEGMGEVAAIVKTHPLHSMLDPAISPKSWEEKLVYLADKMVKHEVITVDKRFALWKGEELPEEAVAVLDAVYPKVKELEHDIFARIGITPAQVAQLVAAEYNESS